MKNPLTKFPQRILRQTPSTALKSLTELEAEMDQWLGFNKWDLLNEFENVDFAPACNFNENGAEYIIQMDIPGTKKDDVKIEIDNNRLIISGKRKNFREEKEDRSIFSETYFGTFMRSFYLHSPVAEEKVNAHYEDGVLTIKVPKLKPTKSREIKIH